MTSQPKDGELLAPVRVTFDDMVEALAPFAFLAEAIDGAFLRFDQGLPPDSVLIDDLFADYGSASISVGSLRRARRVLLALRERGPR